MRLSWIEAVDFRCYPALRMEPDPGVNVFVGSNGAGKTSLLEAVGYLASLASFRGAPDCSLIRQGADRALLRGEFSASTGSALVEAEIPAEGRRRVLLNGKGARGRAAVAAVVAVVAFLPDDLALIKEGPARRREYLDDLAVQLWPAAATEQAEYDRTLRQRNALLRQDGRNADRDTLDAIDIRLAEAGGAVLARRLVAATDVAGPIETVYSELGEAPSEIGFAYTSAGLGAIPGTPSAEELGALLGPALSAARRRDMERGLTTLGPHRDDIEVMVDGRDARTRTSQGEQRSLTLAMRLASYRVIEERRSTAPVLLLDDVFSELDPRRSARLAERLPGGQVFVTSARAEEVPLVGTRWSVTGGGVAAP